ncbi:MAG: AMP-binding protein, partial [Pseudomonadota bacterium]
MAKDATLDLTSFDEFLTHWAKERPDGIALVYGERLTTYAEADSLTRQLVSFLKAQGIAEGDRFAYLGKNTDRYFLLLYAAGRMGAVIAPVGWRLAPREIGYILSDTGSKLLIAEADFLVTAKAVAQGMDTGPEVFDAAEAFTVASTMEPAEGAPPDPQATILQLYTSGTTGNPKGAQLSNHNLFGLRKASVEADLPWQKFEPTDCVLGAMPIAHIGGTGTAPIALGNGIRIQILPEFSPLGALEAIEGG